MSAGAIVIDDYEIHLMSDGILSYKDESGNWLVKNRNTNKIKIINEKIGVLWLGAGLLSIWEEVKREIPNEECENVPEVAECISRIMKSFYSSYDINMGGRVNITGFYLGKPVLIEVTSYENFKIKNIDLSKGTYAWSMIHGVKNNPFPRLFGKYYMAGYSLKQSTRWAFKEAIKYHRQTDVTVGGSTHYAGFNQTGLIRAESWAPPGKNSSL